MAQEIDAGRPPQGLGHPPPIGRMANTVRIIFEDLSRSRLNNGFGGLPLQLSEFESYARITNIPDWARLGIWRAVSQVDAVHMKLSRLGVKSGKD